MWTSCQEGFDHSMNFWYLNLNKQQILTEDIKKH